MKFKIWSGKNWTPDVRLTDVRLNEIGLIYPLSVSLTSVSLSK